MCDYSLHNVKSRPAKVGDELTTRDFGTGTRGFSASEDKHVAVFNVDGRLRLCRATAIGSSNDVHHAVLRVRISPCHPRGFANLTCRPALDW